MGPDLMKWVSGLILVYVWLQEIKLYDYKEHHRGHWLFHIKPIFHSCNDWVTKSNGVVNTAAPQQPKIINCWGAAVLPLHWIWSFQLTTNGQKWVRKIFFQHNWWQTFTFISGCRSSRLTTRELVNDTQPKVIMWIMCLHFLVCMGLKFCFSKVTCKHVWVKHRA